MARLRRLGVVKGARELRLPSAAPEAAPSELDAFMARVVAPEMARLLGRTPARERGVASPSRCFTCHTADE